MNKKAVYTLCLYLLIMFLLTGSYGLFHKESTTSYADKQKAQYLST